MKEGKSFFGIDNKEFEWKGIEEWKEFDSTSWDIPTDFSLRNSDEICKEIESITKSYQKQINSLFKEYKISLKKI